MFQDGREDVSALRARKNYLTALKEIETGAYSFRVPIGIFVMRIKKERKNSIAHASVVGSSANMKYV